MNYYYDIILNFEDEYCMFYEWDNTDNLEFIKKIPILKVSNKTYKDILSQKIKVNNDFLNIILNKTRLNNKGFLKYCCIIGDGKNSLAVEFNDEGIVISKSSILLDDELNINEFMFGISLTNIEYKVLEKEKIRKETRRDEKIKKILITEINNMYKNNNKSKLKYIYLEWFNELKDDYDLMYKKMINKLNGKLTKKEYEIYNLIKMTFSV